MVLFAQWKSPINAASTMRPSAPKPCAWLSESRSTPAAARALNIRPQAALPVAESQAQQPALPTDPAEAAEVRQLRAANRRLAQELEILKKAIAIFSQHPADPVSYYQFIDQERGRLSRAAALPGAGRAAQPLLRLAAAQQQAAWPRQHPRLGNGAGQTF
ncbi:MAG: hypothetical protein WKG07_08140 [Hymenobacter sp.]